MNSILDSVKKSIPIDPSITVFDTDIVMYINEAFMTLFQIGLGNEPVSIDDASTTWDELFGTNVIAFVKPYVCSKVKLRFDPPQNGSHMEALKAAIAEYESRISYEVDPNE